MRKVVFAPLVLALSLSAIVLSAQTSQPTIPVEQIHAGMRGYALTVFEGVKPESMGVEVLGVLHNVNGPKGNIILIRLHGEKAEYTGVVAGMSGSPVYLDGKLAGALAFRIGEFSKEPIAGVTPIAEMLEINAMDRNPGGTTRNGGALGWTRAIGEALRNRSPWRLCFLLTTTRSRKSTKRARSAVDRSSQS